MNEVLAIATILLNGLEKAISYRMQVGAPRIVSESNPVARFAIHRFGLFLSHTIFFFLSILTVILTYLLTSFSSIASVCLWLEFISTAMAFFNNWMLGRVYDK